MVCAMGIRADESSSRAKKPHYQVRGDITTSYLKPERGLEAGQQEDWAENAIALWLERERKGRLALTWNPIFDWGLDAVWRALGTSERELKDRRCLYRAGCFHQALSGWPAHWAYVSGNSRLSCSICVLASAGDIGNGARHNPTTWLELTLMEAISGWSFQQGKWLGSLPVDPVERLEQLGKLTVALYELGLVQRWKPMFALA